MTQEREQAAPGQVPGNEGIDRESVDGHLRFPWREQRLRDGKRCCAWPDCGEEGSYRAPKSRDDLRAFVWFCLDHVREYNRGWNYFVGMSQAEIDAYRRDDVTWHRPTWSFGSRASAGGPAGETRAGEGSWYDPFGFMGDEPEPPRAKPNDRTTTMRMILELADGFTLAELKQRYKVMVKRHHPDVNGGDKAAEERLKLVIEAYTYLRDNELYVSV